MDIMKKNYNFNLSFAKLTLAMTPDDPLLLAISI